MSLQAAEQLAPDPPMLQIPFHAEGNFPGRRLVLRLFVQFRSCKDTAVFHIAKHGCPLGKTPFSICRKEAIADRAIEPVTPAFLIKSKNVLAKQLELRGP